MIELKNIEYKYRKSKKHVFSNFSATIEAGGIYGLLGRNGTGKSTLLYIIAGLLKPQQGTCLMDGQETVRRNANTLSEIFFVPEEFELPNISLKQYIQLNKPFYPNFSEELLNRCLEAFQLPSSINLGQLSMGMKKKAFMSFALATQTRLLLMDEPTNGLDIPSKSQFRKVLSWAATEDRAIVISTHQVKDVEQLLDHFIIIEEDRLLVEASLNDICSKLLFETRDAAASEDGELYSRSSFNGREVIAINKNGEDSPFNLELLFTALVENPEISKYLNNEK